MRTLSYVQVATAFAYIDDISRWLTAVENFDFLYAKMLFYTRIF